ncbi:hypothetical protein JCM17823_26390 [Halorubrum gandharaense]
MTDWDDRFAEGAYPRAPDPSPLLRRYLPEIPDGRALDVAAGSGRNAVFLADAGYEVDAVDGSAEGLRITRERAAERGSADRLRTEQADLTDYEFPTARYDLITVSFYRVVDRLPDVVEALVDGGFLFVEHHLRTTDDVSGPSTDRYRYAANELLHAGLGLTVVHYDEGREAGDEDGDEDEDGGENEADDRATVRLLARRTHGTRQSYPRRPE